MAGREQTRKDNPNMMAAMRPPYSYAAAVDVSAADATFSGYRICELRCSTEGTIKVDTVESTGVPILSSDYDIFQLEITKIYMTGTDAGLRSGAIIVFGFSRNS